MARPKYGTASAESAVSNTGIQGRNCADKVPNTFSFNPATYIVENGASYKSLQIFRKIHVEFHRFTEGWGFPAPEKNSPKFGNCSFCQRGLSAWSSD